MKVTVITAVYNNRKTIRGCLEAVAGQTHPEVEHIIIDGGSTDGTLEILRKATQAKVVSEPDDGMYDAMNKGIRLATGDLVGILNSDDVYADEFVLENVVRAITETGADSCYGDLMYVSKDDLGKVRRYWKSGEFRRDAFKKGWMPPHPTFFVRRKVYLEFGTFNTDFPLAADYELMLRLLFRENLSTTYIPRVLVKMRAGGKSAPALYTAKALIENYRAWRVNDLDPDPVTFLLKPLSKIIQFVRPKTA